MRHGNRSSAKTEKNKRDVFITENYILNHTVPQRKVAPGIDSYAGVVNKERSKLLIVGDSHVRRLNKKNLNSALQGKSSVFMKSYSGANLAYFEYHVTPNLMFDTPDSIIIHIGSNDIVMRTVDNIDAKDIAEKIIKIGKRCIDAGVKHVMVSSILAKRNRKLTAKIREVNDLLYDLCLSNNLTFICNDGISQECLDFDGVHLSEYGSDMLGCNFLDCYNYLTLSRY